ncbi:hypothetical protein AB4Z22_00195 [Paenibacillus sp. TAF58]
MEHTNEMAEAIIENRIESILIKVAECEEIVRVDNEFYANFELIKAILPERYQINLRVLESAMMHIQISGEEQAYRLGLYDGMAISSSIHPVRSEGSIA